VVNAIADQTALVNEPFAYQVVASDPDGHVLTYTLEPPSPVNAAIGLSSGAFTWTPQATGTNAGTVRVTDNGPLALSVTRTFNIIVTRGIRIGAINRVSANELSITLNATAGKTYRAEYKNELSDSAWIPIEPGTLAQGPSVSISIVLGPELHRFFRVVQVD
jgi:putative Ig domain-containing protein